MKASILFCLLFVACSMPEEYLTRNYEINSPMTASVGSTMLSIEAGRKRGDQVTSNRVKELVYNGISGSVIKVGYREAVNGALYQPNSSEVQYDLKESKVITYTDLQIEVLEATNQLIRYRVLRDGR